jgi:predicted nucleic-acid-binding protein
MRIVADTNLLLRAALGDDPVQSASAMRAMEGADAVVVTEHALCEFAWVLKSNYRLRKDEIGFAISKLCAARNVVLDSAALDSGLKIMEAGADFADGVIAYEGRRLGGETFVSFDKKAVAALQKQGVRARLLR